jgi:spermidine synthase
VCVSHDAKLQERGVDRAQANRIAWDGALMSVAIKQEARGETASAPIELVDVADIPGGGQLRLLRCGADYSIHFGDEELMGSEAFQSEQALASLAIGRIAERCDRILIGGLGMGFTLGTALEVLPCSSEVVVAELVPKVVAWANGPLAHLFGEALTDRRVSIEIRDVHDVIDDADQAFDGILLDVDNGPDGLIQLANERLYSNWGLRAAYSALRPGGVLAIWSAYEDALFAKRLANAGFLVDEAKVPDTQGRERAPYTIWLAVRPA